jgi:hypothetical protein
VTVVGGGAHDDHEHPTSGILTTLRWTRWHVDESIDRTSRW